MRVESLGGSARRFRPGTRLTVEADEGTAGAIAVATDVRSLTVRSARDLGDGDVLLRFEEISNPEAAAALRGAYLSVAPGDARELPDREWFVWQLVGLTAVDPQGREIGRVTDIEGGRAHDVMVVATSQGERRFPMVSAFVTEVRIGSGQVVLTPWEEEADEPPRDG